MQRILARAMHGLKVMVGMSSRVDTLHQSTDSRRPRCPIGPCMTSPCPHAHTQQLADGEGLRADLRAAKQGAEDAGRKLVGAERRVVQLQHEAKRKELEYERLQEKWVESG